MRYRNVNGITMADMPYATTGAKMVLGGIYKCTE